MFALKFLPTVLDSGHRILGVFEQYIKLQLYAIL